MKTPRSMIADAWAITKKQKQMRMWGFTSALFETMLSLKLIVYQVWFFMSYMRGEPIGFFKIEGVLMEYLPFGVFATIVVSFLILVFLELIIPHFATGAIIGLGAKAYKKEEVRGGFVLAIYNFLPIFVIHEIFVLASVTTAITFISLVLRYATGFETLGVATVIFLFIFSVIFRFLTMFAEEAVVIRKESFGKALDNSFKIILSYLGHIVFLIILLFVIAIRIVVNAILFFLIPGIIIGLGYLLAFYFPGPVSLIISSCVGFILIAVASYFFAYIEVFRQTVWTIAYLEFSTQKDLDVIEESS